VTKVVIVEDEPLYRALLETSLRAKSIDVVGSYASAEEALTSDFDPEVRIAIIDLVLGEGMDGIIVGNTLMNRNSSLKCVLLTANTSSHLADRLKLVPGNRWSLLRKQSVGDVEQLHSILQGIEAGEIVFQTDQAEKIATQLSPTQRRTLEYVAAGASNTAIARNLGISVRSVEGHISRSFVVLGIDASDVEINARVVAAARLLTDDMLGN
jgi:DNA-binding NarL/FixJ family response regulator